MTPPGEIELYKEIKTPGGDYGLVLKWKQENGRIRFLLVRPLPEGFDFLFYGESKPDCTDYRSNLFNTITSVNDPSQWEHLLRTYPSSHRLVRYYKLEETYPKYKTGVSIIQKFLKTKSKKTNRFAEVMKEI